MQETPERKEPPKINITQRCAILIDANNIEIGIETKFGVGKMLNYDWFVPKVLYGRGIVNFTYFVEKHRHEFSKKLFARFTKFYKGDMVLCDKSADVPLAMFAAMLMPSIDTFIIFSGDGDYVDCVSILKAHGKRVELVGVYGTVSAKLIDLVHEVTYITGADLWVDKNKHKPKPLPYKKPEAVIPISDKPISPQNESQAKEEKTGDSPS